MAGPKSGSLFTPTIISVPPPTIRCTSTPSIRASGARRRTSSSIAPAASRTAAALAQPSRTPPTSLLWAMSGESILRATG